MVLNNLPESHAREEGEDEDGLRFRRGFTIIRSLS